MMDLNQINQMIRDLKITKERINAPEELATKDPFVKFMDWFEEALRVEENPGVMVLATVDSDNVPVTRAVSLQELQENQFIFYSVYNGRKGKHIEHQNKIAVNFYWPDVFKQIRIRGHIEKTSREKSESYFAKRHRDIQLTLHAWKQSVSIQSRDEMEQQLAETKKRFVDKTVPCPDYWGGYVITPYEYEFCFRRGGLKNDILFYTLEDGIWKHERLTP
ncbi:MAG TPA: pyridoxal 5'-phosphate synthase [Legionella sp.]|nr:pyridoxal 5'-phosphate synthase [Legionella sp.]